MTPVSEIFLSTLDELIACNEAAQRRVIESIDNPWGDANEPSIDPVEVALVADGANEGGLA